MSTMASQITGLAIVYWMVYSGTDQRIHQSSASLAFVRGIRRWQLNSPHKGPVTRKLFPFDDVIMTRPWCDIGRYSAHGKFICISFKEMFCIVSTALNKFSFEIKFIHGFLKHRYVFDLEIDGLVQERLNSIVWAMELRFSCTNRSKGLCNESRHEHHVNRFCSTTFSWWF